MNTAESRSSSKNIFPDSKAAWQSSFSFGDPTKSDKSASLENRTATEARAYNSVLINS